MSHDDENNIDEEEYRAAMHPMSVDSRVYLLAERIKILTIDHQELKIRTMKLEAAYQRGVGMFLLFPFLGALVGFLATFWSSIFKPWK